MERNVVHSSRKARPSTNAKTHWTLLASCASKSWFPAVSPPTA